MSCSSAKEPSLPTIKTHTAPLPGVAVSQVHHFSTSVKKELHEATNPDWLQQWGYSATAQLNSTCTPLRGNPTCLRGCGVSTASKCMLLTRKDSSRRRKQNLQNLITTNWKMWCFCIAFERTQELPHFKTSICVDFLACKIFFKYFIFCHRDTKIHQPFKNTMQNVFLNSITLQPQKENAQQLFCSKQMLIFPKIHLHNELQT